MINMIEFLIVFLIGLIFQSILPSELRMILIYPLAIVLGFLAHINILFLVFGLGMTSRALIGGYWTCVLLETICLLIGVGVAFII
jgi:hypothetical protein